jgi:predicted N-formylglutamate amidohydrolase
VTRVPGQGTLPELLVEIPHGATRTADYTALRRRLRGDIAADLVDFFHVNTDVGAPELARALAHALAPHTRGVLIVESAIPRTFIDCNRVIDVPLEAYREGRVTPGVPPWIRDPEDLALLRGLHAEYVRVTTEAFDTVCGGGGFALMLHTYAPRTVDVEVDDHIVAALHAAYADEARWPLRPEVDVIGRDLAGKLVVDEGLLADLTASYAAIGIEVADGRTYPFHPSTTAFHHAGRWAGRAACIEFRRDLLADPWDPFAEMRISPEKAARMAGPLASSLARWMGRGPRA